VRVSQRVIRPPDYQTIRGILPIEVFASNGILGIDGVGVVEAVGANVNTATGVAPGTRVIFFGARGTWAERTVAPATAMTPVPDDIDDAVACQLAWNGLTALTLLRAAEQAAGEAGAASPLLLSAATSSVARNIIALATMKGRKVIGLVRREAEAAALAGQFDGLQVIGTDRSDWPAAVSSAAGNPVQVALDPIGGEMMPKLLGLLAPGGTLITYGALEPRSSPVSSGLITLRELTIRGVSTFNSVRSRSPAQRAADIAAIFEMARRTPQNFKGYRVFPLAEAANAIAAAEAGPRRGATILVS
jgi:NADPH:quinone reductase-like Zn-dependent oxidoreductase